MIFDLHVHTTFSACSSISAEKLVGQAKTKGLDGVCITDHDTMAVKNHLEEGLQKNGLCVIFGMEYTTSQGDFLVFGPFEGLPLGMPARRLLDIVDREGGVAVAAHPFRCIRKTEQELLSAGYCRILEGINGRNLTTENSAALHLAEQHNIHIVNGSDAHSLPEIGQAPTHLHRTIHSRTDFIACLKEKAFSITNEEINFSPLSLAVNS